MTEMLFPVKLHRHWGYINARGDIIVPTAMSYCSKFSDGYGAAVNGNDLVIFDATGVSVGEAHDVHLPPDAQFSNGLLLVCQRQPTTLAGYVNKKGEWVIPPKFRSARTFGNGVAVASDDFLEGLIDSDGNWICAANFHQINTFGTKTSATLAYKHSFGDSKGALRCILINKIGNQIGNELFSQGYRGCGGLIPVKKDNAWGVVNEEGTLVIPFVFDEINSYSEGFAAATDANGAMGLIDVNGHWVAYPKFGNLGFVSEGLCAAANQDKDIKWGYIDLAGDWVIQPRFREAFDFHNGVAKVYIDHEDFESANLCYIDKAGEFVWRPNA